MNESTDKFWKIMDQIAGNKPYGENCMNFVDEESNYTRQILYDKYKPLTAFVDTLVGFFRESISSFAQSTDFFYENQKEKQHHFLLLRATMLRTQAIRKLLTTGYNAEAVGRAHPAW